MQPPKLLLTWGKKGEQPGAFFSPIGIAISKKDTVFVTDLNNARVQKFSVEGTYLGSIELPPDTPPRKSTQCPGIAVDSKGLIYLSFTLKDKIAVYTEAGTLVREWGRHGMGEGEFWQPGGIVLGPNNTLLVADQCNHRVQRFTTEGRFLGQWGTYGSELGQFGAPDIAGSRFAGPHFLAVDRQRRVYTTEGVRGRVQQFSWEGKPLKEWGDKGSQPGGFGALQTPYARGTFGPIALCVDRFDRVWVSSLNDRVQAFTPDGTFLLGIGGTGAEPGQLARPHGLALDSKGHLYICDAGNARIQKFEVPRR